MLFVQFCDYRLTSNFVFVVRRPRAQEALGWHAARTQVCFAWVFGPMCVGSCVRVCVRVCLCVVCVSAIAVSLRMSSLSVSSFRVCVCLHVFVSTCACFLAPCLNVRACCRFEQEQTPRLVHRLDKAWSYLFPVRSLFFSRVRLDQPSEPPHFPSVASLLISD